MRFNDICELILKGERAYAYRKSYPDITTLIGLAQAGNDMALFYYDRHTPVLPLPITKDVYDADDWEVCDEVEDRFCIKQYMTMPKVREFLLDLYDFYNSGNPTDALPKQFMTDTYIRRMHEAVGLGIVYPDTNRKRMDITDIGYDLIKQIDH